MDDGRIQFTQIMLFAGGNSLRAAGILREGITDQEVLVSVAKIYRSMRAIEPEVIKPMFFTGGK